MAKKSNKFNSKPTKETTKNYFLGIKKLEKYSKS